MSLMLGANIWAGARGGGMATAPSAWETLLDSLQTETDGMVLYFTDPTYPRALIRDTTTPANSVDQDANLSLTYTSPSLKNRLAADGLIKYAAHNLALDSEDIGSVNWTAADTTRPSASVLREAATTAQHLVGQAFTAVIGFTYSVSVELKYTSRQWINLALYVGGAGYNHRAFDVQNGIEGASNGAEFLSSSIEAVGDGWYKCTVNCIAAAGTTGVMRIVMAESSGTNYAPSYAGNTANEVQVRKVHLRIRPADTDYITTTTAAKYRLPIEYDTAGDPVGLLVEEARTNLVTYSEQFDNAAWTKVRATVTANAVAAPDGTTTADKIQPNGNAGNETYATQSPSVTSGTPVAISVYAKDAGTGWLALCLDGAGDAIAYFNVAAGSVGTVSGTYAGKSATITSVGNGWYRCVFVVTPGVTGSRPAFILVAEADGDINFASGTTNGVYVWGAQLEAGSFPTSYIRTVAATVTRAADNISMATSAMPYSATAGYFKVHHTLKALNYSGAGGVNFRDNIGSNAGTIGLYANEFQQFSARNAASTELANIDSGTLAANTLQKIAAAYETDNFAASVNGGAAVADTSGTLDDTQSTMWVGFGLTGRIQVVKYLKRRVSNADLALESA